MRRGILRDENSVILANSEHGSGEFWKIRFWWRILDACAESGCLCGFCFWQHYVWIYFDYQRSGCMQKTHLETPRRERVKWDEMIHVMSCYYVSVSCHVMACRRGWFLAWPPCHIWQWEFAGTFSRRHRWVFVGPRHLCVHGPPAYTLWFRVSHTLGKRPKGEGDMRWNDSGFSTHLVNSRRERVKWDEMIRVMSCSYIYRSCHVMAFRHGWFLVWPPCHFWRKEFAGTFSRRHRWVFVGPCHLYVHGPPAYTLWFRVSHTHTPSRGRVGNLRSGQWDENEIERNWKWDESYLTRTQRGERKRRGKEQTPTQANLAQSGQILKGQGKREAEADGNGTRPAEGGEDGSA